MNEQEFRIRLNTKKECHIFGMQVKQYTIDEILDGIGYDKFNYIRNFVNTSCDSFDSELEKYIDEYMFSLKENLMLENKGMNYDLDYTLFDMCCYVDFIRGMFINFLNTFTCHKIIMVKHEPLFDEMVIVYDDNQLVLDRKNFDEFIDMFSILNYTVRVDRNLIRDSEDVKEFNNRASEIKQQLGWKEHQDVTLESIISSLIDSDNSSYTHENICYKTIYQILNSFNRMCKAKDNDFMNLVRVNSAQKISKNDIMQSTWYYNFY